MLRRACELPQTPASARHTCSAAQLVAIGVLALVLTSFLVALLPVAGEAYQSSLKAAPLPTEQPCWRADGKEYPCWREHSGTGVVYSLPPPTPPPPPPAPAPPRPLKLIIISDWHTHPDYSPSVRPGSPCFCSNSSFGKSTKHNTTWQYDFMREGQSCARPQPASPYGQIGCDSPETLASTRPSPSPNMPQP